MTPNFELTLDLNPDDWDSRLIYSDYLEEQGHLALAKAQRWMKENGRRSASNCVPDEVNWVWGNIFELRNSKYATDSRYGMSVIPAEIFHRLETFLPCSTRYWRYYLSRQQAELALAIALEKVSCPLPQSSSL